MLLYTVLLKLMKFVKFKMNGDRESLKIFLGIERFNVRLLSDALFMAFRRNDLLKNIG